MPRTRRSFPAEFKAQVVLQLLSGEASQAELCRKHNIKPNLIANWKAAVLERLHTVFEAEGYISTSYRRTKDIDGPTYTRSHTTLNAYLRKLRSLWNRWLRLPNPWLGVE